LVAGVGGMGVLTTAKIISEAAMIEGYNVVMSEVHGLAQRYGMVHSAVRIGDVVSPLIKKGNAHIVLGLEPVEALRFAYMVRRDGYIIVNENPIPPPTVSAGFDEYPDVEKVLSTLSRFTPNIIKLNALEVANEIGNPRVQNTILLGVAFAVDGFPLSKESGYRAIEHVFEGKEKVIELNLRAFDFGYDFAKKKVIKWGVKG